MLQPQIVLTFHGLGQPARPLELGEETFWISVPSFEWILDYVANLNPEMRAHVALTFDDGNLSDVLIALPRLLARDLTAHFFVVAGRLSLPQFLSSLHLKKLRAAGMEVGCHGYDHVDWRYASDAVLDQEIELARKTIEDAIGEPVDAVAIPYGSYDQRVLRRIRRAGYKTVFTTDGGISMRGSWLQSRECVRRTMRPPEIKRLVSDASVRGALLQGPRLVKQYLVSSLAGFAHHHAIGPAHE